MDAFGNNGGQFPIERGLVEQFPEQGIQALDDQEWSNYYQELLGMEKEQPFLQEMFRDNSAVAVAQGDTLYQEQLLQEQPSLPEELFRKNSAAAVGNTLYQEWSRMVQGDHHGDHQAAAAAATQTLRNTLYQEWSHVVQGDHQDDHQEAAAAMQTLSEPVGGSTSAPKTIEIKVELWGRRADKKSRYKFRVDPTDKVSILKVLLVNKKAQLPERYLFTSDGAVLNEDRTFLKQVMVGVGVPTVYVQDSGSNFS